MILVLGLLSIGPLVGIVSTFFGVGGGIIVIPTLYALFPNYPPQMVMATSLGMIFFNASLNTIRYVRNKQSVFGTLYLVLLLMDLTGAAIGASLTFLIGRSLLKAIFALILFAVLIRTSFVKENQQSASDHFDITNNVLWKGGVLAFIGGTLAGLTGLGGGIILIPLFMAFLRMPLSLIPRYTNGMMIFTSIMGIGIFSYLMPPDTPVQLPASWLYRGQLGPVNLFIIGPIVLGARLTAGLGAKLSERVSHRVRKHLFLIMLFLLASKMFYMALFRG